MLGEVIFIELLDCEMWLVYLFFVLVYDFDYLVFFEVLIIVIDVNEYKLVF